MTFHLFIVALAGAGAAVIAMVRPQSSEAWLFYSNYRSVACRDNDSSLMLGSPYESDLFLISVREGRDNNGQKN